MRDTIKLAIRIDELNDAYYDHPSDNDDELKAEWAKLESAIREFNSIVPDELHETEFASCCRSIIEHDWYTDSTYDELGNSLWDFIIAAVLNDVANMNDWVPLYHCQRYIEQLTELKLRHDKFYG